MTTRKQSCAMCEREVAERYRPFCSRRCADRDLAGWFGEHYRLTEQAPFDELEPEELTQLEEALAGALAKRGDAV